MTAHGGVIVGPGVPYRAHRRATCGAGRGYDCVSDGHTRSPANTTRGGPITGPGSPMVLIGGMPAARVGDMTQCVGPPGVISGPGMSDGVDRVVIDLSFFLHPEAAVNDFIGTGWAFPIKPDGRGGMELVSGPEEIRQAIWMILSTAGRAACDAADLWEPASRS